MVVVLRNLFDRFLSGEKVLLGVGSDSRLMAFTAKIDLKNRYIVAINETFKLFVILLVIYYRF